MPDAHAPSYDDLPSAREALPPETREPLAPFGGAPPAAPPWFHKALEHAPERGFVATPRGCIEVLTWGERGKPGLLFLHGNGAHADWWSYICPFFAGDYRVTAMSLAGMGGSDWRDSYAFEDFAEDAEAVARATGLYEGGREPVYIGHSFGGGQVFYIAVTHPDRMAASIIIDAGFSGPPPEVLAERQRRLAEIMALPPEQRPSRVYPTLAEALLRFRLAPPQPAENLYIVDHIARHGLKPVPRPDGSGEGWTWKFDPDIWEKLDRTGHDLLFGGKPEVRKPIAHIAGELSSIPRWLHSPGRGPFPADGLQVEIPDAHHHVMIDQPLALVSAIRSLLAAWRA